MTLVISSIDDGQLGRMQEQDQTQCHGMGKKNGCR